MHIISLTPENLWGWYYHVSIFTDEETNVQRVRWLPMVTKWWSRDCNTFLSHSKAQREGRKLPMTFPALNSYVNTHSRLLSDLLNCKRKTKGLLRRGEHPYLCWKLGNLVITCRKQWGTSPASDLPRLENSSGSGGELDHTPCYPRRSSQLGFSQCSQQKIVMTGDEWGGMRL